MNFFPWFKNMLINFLGDEPIFISKKLCKLWECFRDSKFEMLKKSKQTTSLIQIPPADFLINTEGFGSKKCFLRILNQEKYTKQKPKEQTESVTEVKSCFWVPWVFLLFLFSGLVNETACVFPDRSTTWRLENWKAENLSFVLGEWMPKISP